MEEFTMKLTDYFKNLKKHKSSHENIYEQNSAVRQEFFKQLKPCENANLVERIYVGEDICILNFCDVFYLGCCYLSAQTDFLSGMVLSCNSIENFIKDETLLMEYICSLDNNSFEEVTVDLRESNLEHMIKYREEKKKTVSTPTKHIDKNLEKE